MLQVRLKHFDANGIQYFEAYYKFIKGVNHGHRKNITVRRDY